MFEKQVRNDTENQCQYCGHWNMRHHEQCPEITGQYKEWNDGHTEIGEPINAKYLGWLMGIVAFTRSTGAN